MRQRKGLHLEMLSDLGEQQTKINKKKYNGNYSGSLIRDPDGAIDRSFPAYRCVHICPSLSLTDGKRFKLPY